MAVVVAVIVCPTLYAYLARLDDDPGNHLQAGGRDFRHQLPDRDGDHVRPERDLADDRRGIATGELFHKRLETPVGGLPEDQAAVKYDAEAVSPFGIVGVCVICIGLLMLAVQPWIDAPPGHVVERAAGYRAGGAGRSDGLAQSQGQGEFEIAARKRRKSRMNAGERLTRGQWFALAAAFLGWMFDGMVLGLLPLVSRPALKDLLNITDDALVGLWHGRMVACFLVGAACGGVFFGWLGDKFGRVRAMIFSILAYSLFTGCGYFATEPWHLGLFFFLAALGLGGQWSLGVALVMECWPEKARPVLAGVIGAASNVGFLMIAVVGACHPVTPDSWRWLMLVGASPAVLALLIAFFVPESQRWKDATKKGGEARSSRSSSRPCCARPCWQSPSPRSR